MGALKKAVVGVGGAVVAAFGIAVYDYGLNIQDAEERVTMVDINVSGGSLIAKGDLIRTKSGNEYRTMFNEGPSAGMFFDSRDVQITYTGGIANALLGVPRNPIAIQKLQK